MLTNDTQAGLNCVAHFLTDWLVRGAILQRANAKSLWQQIKARPFFGAQSRKLGRREDIGSEAIRYLSSGSVLRKNAGKVGAKGCS